MEKKPFHEVVAEKLIEQLKNGTAPWLKPWSPGPAGSGLPMNPTTGKRYKGINGINLMMQGRSDQRWMTYKQAAAVDAQVRKGEKGTPVQYWKFSEERNKKDENGKPVMDAKGEPVKERFELERPKVFLATVFNAEQIDGLPPLEHKEQAWNAVERAEQILQASGANILHVPGDRAFYRPSTDTITMPEKGQFESADRYYATGLHELGHWTGHPSRLDRDLSHPFGSEGYAKEELRAEIASMILGDEIGIGHDPEQHVAYVASWIKALENDPLEIFRAAADAEKIQAFVLELEQRLIQQQESSQSQNQVLTTDVQAEVLAHLEETHKNANPGYSALESWSALQQAAELGGFKAVLSWSEGEKYDPDIRVHYLDSDGHVLPIHTDLNSGDGKAVTSLNGKRVPGTGMTSDEDWIKEAFYSAEASMHRDNNYPILNVTVEPELRQLVLPDRPWQKNDSESTLLEAFHKAGLHTLADVTGTHPQQFLDTARQRLSAVFNVSGPNLDWDIDSPVTLEPQLRARDDVARHFADRATTLTAGGQEMQAPVAEKQMVAERWVLDQMAGDIKPALERMNQRQLETVQTVLESMIPVNMSNALWQRHDAAAQTLLDDPEAISDRLTVSLKAVQERIVALSDQQRESATPNVSAEPEGPMPEQDVTTNVEQLTPLELTASNALQVQRNYRANGDYDAASVHIEEAFNPAFERAFGEEIPIPPTWTGGLQIRGCVEADGVVEEAVDQPATFYGVYAQNADGLHMWIADRDTKEQAQEFAGRLKLIDAFGQTNDDDRALKLAQIREEQLRQDPNSTMEAISDAKAARKDAEMTAVLSDPDFQQRVAELEKSQVEQRPNSDAEKQPNTAKEKTWLVVPYSEREEAKKVAGNLSNGKKAIDFDRVTKCWFAVPGADLDKLKRWMPENNPVRQEQPMSARDEFALAMKEAGLLVQGEHPIMDGERHRVPVEGAKGKKTDGMYVAFALKPGEKGVPAGFIANNRTGVQFNWKSKGYALSETDKAALQAESATNQAIRDAKKAERQAEVSIAIRELLAIAPAAPADHTYLKNKEARPGVMQVVPSDTSGLPDTTMILIGRTSKESKALRDANDDKLVFTAGDLLLTAQNVNEEIQSVQTIRPNGTKMFAKDSTKHEGFHVVGGVGLKGLESAPVIVIGEGYATADTLSQSLGFATVAAFDSGNLPHVAKLLHERFPDKPVLIAGDNDLHQELIDDRNPGRTKAEEAAKAVDGKAIYPIFAPGEQSYPAELGPIDREQARLNKLPPEQQEALNKMKKYTDFNDLATRSVLGRDGLDRQVKSAVELLLQKQQARVDQSLEQINSQVIDNQPRRARSVGGM